MNIPTPNRVDRGPVPRPRTARRWRALPALLPLLYLLLTGCAQISALRPTTTPPELIKAAEFLHKGDQARAIAQFEAIIKQNPKDLVIYEAIGSLLTSASQPALGGKYIEQGLAASPDAPAAARARALLNAASCYMNARDSAKAVQLAEAAYKLSPDDPEVLNGLGYMYAEMYDTDMPDARVKLIEAERLITKALTKAKENGATDFMMGQIVDSLGWVHFKLHNYDRAVAELQRAAELLPDMKEILYHLGRAYQKREMYPDARVAIRRTLTLDNSFQPAKEALAEIDAVTGPGAPSGSPSSGPSDAPGDASSNGSSAEPAGLGPESSGRTSMQADKHPPSSLLRSPSP